MKIKTIGAVLCSARFEEAIGWFEALFERAPDAMPMPGVAEWEFSAALFQLVDEPQRAGTGRATIFVDDLDVEIAGLALKNVAASEITEGTISRLIEIEDLDGNLIALTQPRQVWSL
ncbi:VOC family protein [Limoniibacter endophyticus]|uniref:Glyoxalase n=1 Tax=Limoniibacter endophyticus TaxID=1565040 RepID=A0A8J3DNM1_9HYPH|nr:VOC family protein [Limoniibacter endophyticus]GHC68535.1 glyoxalase [Limoniibacter endophyticus]